MIPRPIIEKLVMREQLVSGDVAALKACLSSIVDAIVVSDIKIHISPRMTISEPPSARTAAHARSP